MKKLFLSLFSLFFIGAIAAGGVAFYTFNYFATPGPLAEQKIVFIKPRSGFVGTVDVLSAEGAISQPELFKLGALAQRKNHQIKAGEYQFTASITPQEVLNMMVEGRVYQRKITIPEGFTSFQAVEAIRKAEALEGDINSEVKEGSLLPDTYAYVRGDKRSDVLKRMQEPMTKLIDDNWEKKPTDLPIKSKDELLILASIVEKETSIDEERTKVAAVYINRLKQGMKLEADPTVIYGITLGRQDLGRPLTLADLQAPTPHNTYANIGLPATPIANPGRKSILAVLSPAETKDLYFVANGKGGHTFAETYEQHQKNVQVYRALKKEEK